MICPKCGREIEGTKCPYCDGPDVVVKNTDYIQRKKAYEEQLARDAENRKQTEQELQRRKEAAQQDFVAGMVSHVRTTGSRAAAQKAKQAADKAGRLGIHLSEVSRKKLPFLKRNRKFLLIGAGAAAAIVAAIIIAVTLLGGVRQNLFYLMDGSVWMVNGKNTTQAGDASDVVYAADGSTFALTSFPDGISGLQLQSSMASKNGSYFAAVTYDPDSAKYAVWIWNAGGAFTKIAENTRSKNLIQLSDKGKLIYTATEVINDQFALGTTSLAVYTISGSSSGSIEGSGQQIDDSVKQVNVYDSASMILCLDGDSSLYLYDYANMGGKTDVAANVTALDTMTQTADYQYSSQPQTTNFSTEAQAFFYQTGGVWYYRDLTGKTKMKVALTSSSADFVYQEKAGYLYLIQTTGISAAAVSSNTVADFQTLGIPGQQENYLYLSSVKKLLYVSSDGALCAVQEAKQTGVYQGVTAGSLSAVQNKTGAFTCVADGQMLYFTDTKATPVSLQSVSASVTTLAQACVYNSRIYYLDESGTLYSSTLQGKEQTEIGTSGRCWIGTEISSKGK